MAASPIEISGIFIREFWRSADGETAGILVEVAEPVADGGEPGVQEVSVFLQCRDDELLRDQEYRFLGSWGTAKNGRGRPFNATSFILKLPHGRTGIISYLVQAGQGLRFGPVRAAAIYDEWGQQAIEKCRASPGEVVELMQRRRLRFDHAAAVNLAARLGDDAALEACTLDLLDVLVGRGFPRATIRECTREWGNRAAMIVRRDPFKLMRFRGCGFKRCDATWLELGLPAGRLKRQALAAWYAIAKDSEGHTWFGDLQAVRGVEQSIAGAEVKAEKALRLAVRGGLMAEVRSAGVAGPISEGGNVRWVAERKKAENERELAEMVAGAMREGVRWP